MAGSTVFERGGWDSITIHTFVTRYEKTDHLQEFSKI